MQRDEEVTCSLFRNLRLPPPFPPPQPDQQPAGARLPLPCWQARRLLANAGGRTDFRGIPGNDCQREAGCIFSALGGGVRVLLENKLDLCIADAEPVTAGHSLVIPRHHVADWMAMHQPEWFAVVELLR